ncbi:MFS family permease [Lipingzhangella halophila]|uniref:MFS family permease n=1 Tax=Lipingzhangella halophila TaxID=1783352 RepID=A0A7W7RJ07_9ACTN|nr:MFS transporter [Lipingzhangella halophila]MBB4932882.1 MFS family permease [Lipingzhangella halophila]
MTIQADRVAPGRLARGTILAAATLTIMAPAGIAPSLPEMGEVYADQPGADLLVRLTVTVTSLMIALTAPISGVLADRVGRRPLLVSSLVLYAVSGSAGYFIADLYLLLATRALLGVAVGGIMTTVSATITDWFDGPKRSSFLGLQQVFTSLGGVVFLPLAGLLANFGWRVPFWIYAVGAVVALFAVLVVRDQPRDLPAPSSRGRMMTGRVLAVYAVALIATLAFYMAPTQVPFLLTDFAVGPAVVGVVVAGSTLTSALGAFGFPALRKRLRSTAITLVSLALLGAGWLLAGAFDTVIGVAVGLLVGGVGVGFAVPNLNLLLSELAAPHWRGRILSGLVTAIFLGQFLSPLVVQPLVQAAGVGGAFTWAGLVMVAGAALAAAGMWKRSTHGKEVR